MAAHATARIITRAQRAARLRGIYLIVNEDGGDPVGLARAALDAGVRVVQYRAKSGIVEANLHSLRQATQARDALLIVNDDWQAAAAFDCDGVHLGPDDAGFFDVAPVRAELGERVIGLSCGTPADIAAANAHAVDYVGVGSVYATASKHDAGEPIGIDGLTQIARETALPVAAIGGIGPSNLAAVRRTGVAMAAVISAVADDASPYAAASRLVNLWNQGATP